MGNGNNSSHAYSGSNTPLHHHPHHQLVVVMLVLVSIVSVVVFSNGNATTGSSSSVNNNNNIMNASNHKKKNATLLLQSPISAHDLLPLFQQVLAKHCMPTSSSASSHSSTSGIIIGGVDFCEVYELRRRMQSRKALYHLSSRYYEFEAVMQNKNVEATQQGSENEERRTSDFERKSHGSLENTQVMSNLAKEWLQRTAYDATSPTVYAGGDEEVPSTTTTNHIDDSSTPAKKKENVAQRMWSWIRKIRRQNNSKAVDLNEKKTASSSPSTPGEAVVGITTHDDTLLSHLSDSESGVVTEDATIAMLTHYIFDGLEGMAPPAKSAPTTTAGGGNGGLVDLWSVFENQQLGGGDGKAGTARFTIPSLDETVGSSEFLRRLQRDGSGSLRGTSSNPRVAQAALAAAIKEVASQPSSSSSQSTTSSSVTEKAKFIERYTGPAYYHLWKPQDVKFNNDVELATIIYRRQKQQEAQERIIAHATEANNANTRGFTTQAVDCSASVDPCKPYGYCQSGICVCVASPSTGYWSGLQCQDCLFGYSGASCQQECQGGFCNPCSGNGICNQGIIGDGSCSCFSDSIRGYWNGVLCDVCLDGYFGTSCTETCPGTTAEDGLPCNGRGECLASGNGVCTCQDNWGSTGGCADCDVAHYGDGCTKECPGTATIGAIITSCSGHGTCFSGQEGNGTCVCDDFYSGLDCGTACPSNCGGHGECDSGALNTGTCTCDQNWAPPSCTTCYPNVTGPTCTVPCPIGPNGEPCSLNGVCSFSGTAAQCTCALGYTDNPDTLDPVCAEACPGTPPCNGHGTCLAVRNPTTLIVSYQCQCYNSAANGYYSGTTCDVCQMAYNQSTSCKIACPSSSNGVCNGQGECRNGFCICFKPLGTLKYCGVNCESVVIVVDPPIVCGTDCPGANQYGPSCTSTCPGVVGSDACNGHGKCYDGTLGNGQCYCYDGYSGTGCEFTCPQALNGQVCSGRLRGDCVAGVNATEGTCQCKPGFAGSACEDECEWGFGQACSGRGTCMAGGYCECTSPEWTGSACETKCLCNTDHGKCDQQLCSTSTSSNFCQQCDCDQGFAGSCISCAAGWQGNSCSDVCGTHGTTVGKICQCEPLWSNATCTVPCPEAIVQNGTYANGTAIMLSLVCGGQGVCKDGRLNDGTCQCYPLSAPTYFGAACNVYCTNELCRQNGVENPQCNPTTGECECLDDINGHWTTDTTLVGTCNTCIEGYWGPTCVEECNCNNHGVCNVFTGTCACYSSLALGYYTGTTCSECDQGYIGENCNRINVLITRITTERPVTNGTIPTNTNAYSAVTAITFDDLYQRIYVGSPTLILDATDLSEFPMLARTDTDPLMSTHFGCTKGGVYYPSETFMVYTDVDQVYYIMQPDNFCNKSLEIIIFYKNNVTRHVRTEPFADLGVNTTKRIIAVDSSLRLLRGLGNPYTSIVLLVADVAITSTDYANANGNVQDGVNGSDSGSYTNPLPGNTIIQTVVGTSQLIWWNDLAPDAYTTTIPSAVDDPPYSSVVLPVSFTSTDVTIAPADRGEVTSLQFVIISGSTSVGNNEYTAEMLMYQRLSKVISAAVENQEEVLQSQFPCWPTFQSASVPQCEFPGASTSSGTCTACPNCSFVTKVQFISSGNLALTMVSTEDTFVSFAQAIKNIPVGSDYQFLGKVLGQCVLMYREDEFNVQVIGGSRYSTVCQSQQSCLGEMYAMQVARLYDTAAIVDSLAIDVYASIGFAAVVNGIARTSRVVKFSLDPGNFGIYGSIQLSYYNVVQGATDGGVETTITMPERIRTINVAQRQRLLYAPITGVSSLRLATFLGYEVEKLSPDIADTRGNSTITISGNGYPVPIDSSVHNIYCRFDTETISAKVVNKTHLECPSPLINGTSTTIACVGYPLEVSLFNTKSMFTNNLVNIRRVQSAVLKSVTPARGRKSDETVVTIVGSGFVESVEAKCKFYSSSNLSTEVGYSELTIIDPNTITCVQPIMAFASKGKGLLDVSLDGSLYTNRPQEYEVVGDAQFLSVTDIPGITAENISWFNVSSFVVDAEQHRLGDLDVSTDEFLLETDIREIKTACNPADYQWRTIDDGFPYPPCRPIYLNNFYQNLTTGEYITNFDIDRTWENSTRKRLGVQLLVNKSKDGIVYFRNLFFVQPRVAELQFTITGDGMSAVATIVITEGSPVALAISNSLYFKENPLIIPDNNAPIPDVDVIMVDINGNIIISGTSASNTTTSTTSYTVSVIAYNIDDETNITEIDTRAQLPSPADLTYSKVVLSYIHGVSHYLQFSSIQDAGVPPLRSATTPPMRTKTCSGTTSVTMYKVARSGECLLCPSDGAVCNGTETILVKPGYWRAPGSSVNIYVCAAGESVCLGNGISGNGSFCADGYDANLPLCAVCEDGFGKSGQNACAACDNFPQFIAIVVVVGIAVLVGILVWVIVTLRKAETTDLSVLMRTIVNHMQATGELGEFSVRFDPFVRTLFSIQGTGSSMSINGLQSADCILRRAGGNYESLFWLYMSLPIGCVVIAVLVFAVVRIGKLEPIITDQLRREIRVDIESVGKGAKSAILLEKYPFYMVLITTMCVTMFTLYQILITQSTKVLKCTEYIIGITTQGELIKQQYLDVDITIKCTSKGDHDFSTAATVFTVGYGVGIPAAFVFGYFFVNSRTKPELTKLMFMFLTGGYQEQYWYWQAIIMIRKMAIVIVLVFITNAKLQTYCGMIAMAIALVLQVLVSPSEKAEHNLVEALSLAIITLTMNLSMVYFWPDLPDAASTAVTVLLATITIGALLMFAVFSIEPLKQTILEARDAVKETIEEGIEYLAGNDNDDDEEAAEEERRKRLLNAASKGLLTDDHLDDYDEFEDLNERTAPPAEDKDNYHPPTNSAQMSYYAGGAGDDTRGIPKTEGTLKAIIARRATKKSAPQHSTGLQIEHETHAEWDTFDGNAGYGEYDLDDGEEMQEQQSSTNNNNNKLRGRANNTSPPDIPLVEENERYSRRKPNNNNNAPSTSRPKYDFGEGDTGDWRSRFL